jgi:type VI secretion system protein ImpE
MPGTGIDELIRVGDLAAATQEATQQVRNHPTDLKARTSLFELLCLAGEFDRAEKQLDVLEQQREKSDLGVQVYRNCVRAERQRHRFYADGVQPHFLNEPPAYVDLHLEAVRHIKDGRVVDARRVLDRAEEERQALSGRRDEKPFQDFRDWDDLTAPVLEVFVHDKFTWLPFEQIRRLEILPPKQLRDMIWATARIESLSGTKGEVILPALYHGTAQDPNDQVRLGRMTEWRQIGENLYHAVGLRIFLVDDEDQSLFETKTIEFDSLGKVVA